MDILTVIPARMGSHRFPGKPLALLKGEAMVVHCIRRAQAANLGPVILATGDQEIAEMGRAHTEVVLTRGEHASGTDRVWEAVERFDSEGRFEKILNMQGDLPGLAPEVLQTLGQGLDETEADILTLAAPIQESDEADNPNIVKVVAGLSAASPVARALYFTRTRAPWGEGLLWHHVGLYGFRRAALARFVGLPVGVLEARERLEQLRALEGGMSMAVRRIERAPLGVDTPEDLAHVEALL